MIRLSDTALRQITSPQPATPFFSAKDCRSGAGCLAEPREIGVTDDPGTSGSQSPVGASPRLAAVFLQTAA
jgi:hypothetical protein